MSDSEFRLALAWASPSSPKASEPKNEMAETESSLYDVIQSRLKRWKAYDDEENIVYPVAQKAGDGPAF